MTTSNKNKVGLIRHTLNDVEKHSPGFPARTLETGFTLDTSQNTPGFERRSHKLKSQFENFKSFTLSRISQQREKNEKCQHK